MWPFKSKFQKLTREEVVDSICKLEKESADLEAGLDEKQKKIDALMQKGRTETVRDVKLLWAKRVNALKAERAQDVQRIMYLMYNIQMLQKLKRAIDDNQFFAKTPKQCLGGLLGDQKGLARFLNQALNTRVSAEKVLTDADETFRSIEEAYEPSSEIYGVGQDDDALLAMFETEEQIADEQEQSSTAAAAKTDTTNS